MSDSDAPTSHSSYPAVIPEEDSESAPPSIVDTKGRTRRRVKFCLCVFGALLVVCAIVTVVLLATLLKPNRSHDTGTTRSTTLGSTTTTRSPDDPCPLTFNHILPNKCWRFFDAVNTTDNAREICNSTILESHLVTINTDEENRVLGQFLGSQNSTWLDLTCFGIEPNMCKWSDGQRLDDDDSRFFEPDNPNWLIGGCVYYSKSTGLWTSSLCNERLMPFVCELRLS